MTKKLTVDVRRPNLVFALKYDCCFWYLSWSYMPESRSGMGFIEDFTLRADNILSDTKSAVKMTRIIKKTV